MQAGRHPWSALAAVPQMGRAPGSVQNSGAVITLAKDTVLLLVQLKIALAFLDSHDPFLAPNKLVVF